MDQFLFKKDSDAPILWVLIGRTKTFNSEEKGGIRRSMLYLGRLPDDWGTSRLLEAPPPPPPPHDVAAVLDAAPAPLPPTPRLLLPWPASCPGVVPNVLLGPPANEPPTSWPLAALCEWWWWRCGSSTPSSSVSSSEELGSIMIPNQVTATGFSLPAFCSE